MADNNWYDPILELGSGAWEWLTDDGNAEEVGAFLGATGTALDWFENDQKKAGYQGKIPEYTAVREQLPVFDPNRRPGGGGQRYFTDTYYGQTPEDQQTVGSLANAQAAADAQKVALVAQNPEQFARGGIVGALNGMRRSLPVDGMQPPRPWEGPQYINSCFLAGTKIAMSDGTEKDIENVVVGDTVKAFDIETGEVIDSPVPTVFVHPNTNGYYIINNNINVTGNHPMRVDDEWKDVDNLKVGDNLHHLDGSKVNVETIDKIEDTVTTYNFEVKNVHNYFANNHLVHNKSLPVDGMQPPRPWEGPQHISSAWKEAISAKMYSDAIANSGISVEELYKAAGIPFKPNAPLPPKQIIPDDSEYGNYPGGPNAPAPDVFTGGTPYFDENTGLYTGGPNAPKSMPPRGMAQGGIVNAMPRAYLNGSSDGMGDQVPAMIDNQRPASLSHGEMVIPADVVSHMGNGNSDAGAQQFYDMMDRVRKARTGNKQQGKQINPNKFIPR